MNIVVREPFGARLDRLDGIGIDEVLDRAELLDRRDRKYLLAPDELARLLGALPDGTRVLEIGGRRSFRYRSVYFDTPGFDSYLAAARGRPRRWKLRVRTYVDSGESWLELKVRDRCGRTVKHRRPRPPAPADALAAAEREYATHLAAGASIELASTDLLVPTLTTAYERVTLVDPLRGNRATIDLRLRADLDDGRRVLLPDLAVVETKCADRAGDIDRALWSAGRRPLRLSKYATCLAAARPELPANRWRRTIRLAGFRTVAA